MSKDLFKMCYDRAKLCGHILEKKEVETAAGGDFYFKIGNKTFSNIHQVEDFLCNINVPVSFGHGRG